MLSFNPDEYRQRLNLALGLRDPSVIGAKPVSPPPAQIENPYDTEQAPVQRQPQQEQPKGGGPNLGALAQMAGGMMGGQGGMGGAGGLPDTSDVSSGDGGGAEMGHWEGTPVLGDGSPSPNLGGGFGGGMIDESGAMGVPPAQASEGSKLPLGKSGKIQMGPPDLEPELDNDALGKAKTIDEVFDAAAPKTQTAYMDWWEKSYGSINEKYDAMRKQLGTYEKLPEKMSKKQMFTLLLGYGARMMSNMRVGREGGDQVDPMAASDDAFRFGQDTAMGNRMTEDEYGANLGAIEGARARELKGIGNQGDALNKASEIAYRDAQRENLGRTKGERFTAADGLVYTIEGESAKPVMGPGGKQLRGQLTEKGGANSEYERAKQSYLQAHGYDADGKKLTGAAWKKVEQEAIDHARYGSRQKDDATTNLDDLRTQARARVDTIIRAGQDIFRGLEPEEIAETTARMEEREFNRLKRENLGSSPLQGGPRAAAPKRSEDFVRSRPETLEDFVADYGYVPEGMEQHVTPAIKQRLGR